VSAKSGHRRPLYFNLCSLSQAEEQQLLQQEQRTQDCQQSRQEGSPHACYPVERRKIGKDFPSRDPSVQKQILAGKSKSCSLQHASAVLVWSRSGKTEPGKNKYLYTHMQKHTCIYVKNKLPNVQCSHWILLMLVGTIFSSIYTFGIIISLKREIQFAGWVCFSFSRSYDIKDQGTMQNTVTQQAPTGSRE